MKQFSLSTMVDYHHDDNLYRRASKRRRFKVAAYALSGTLVIVVALIIYDGLRSDTTVTTETTNQTLGGTQERAVFDEPLFRITADTSWRKIESRETTSFHYQSFRNGLSLRDLRVYVNNTPEEFPITYVLPIEVSGNKVLPLSISPHCKEIVPNKKSVRDQMTEWAGVNFLCDPDSPLYIVGTSHNKDGYNTRIAGKSGGNRFFFVYRDFEPVARLNVFANLLSTFEAK